MNVSLVYVTTIDQDEAGHIGKVLVAKKLAASVNIISEVRSIYRWGEEVYDKSEALLIAKTSTIRVSEVIEKIRSLHSYQCPCIVTWCLESGNDAYLDWIRLETAQ